MVSIRSSDGKSAFVEEGVPKSKCEKQPAGHPVEMSNGKTACLYLYDKDGSPIDGFDNIENISIGEGQMQVETEEGEKETFEV